MKRLVIEPDGWSCRLEECRPGLFVFQDILCIRNDYHEFFLCDGGDAFWGGAKSKEERAQLSVQPVKAVWVEEESY